METLVQLNQKLNSLNLENPTFIVEIREDNYENTNDANYYENNSFDSLEEAYEDYLKEVANISSIETNSEFKSVKLVAITEDGDYEELEEDSYENQYEESDYGKYLISYSKRGYNQTNNGVVGITIEIIDKYTKYIPSDEGSFGLKFQVEDNKEDVMKFLYNEMLFVGMDRIEEIFEESLIK